MEWFHGSALRPFLSPLDEEMRKGFVADFSERVARAYPPRFDGRVLLRFPRLFIVAIGPIARIDGAVSNWHVN